MLQTFASQSALAILNARLFRQLEGLNSLLRRFMPQQVADLILQPGEAASLETHRRRIAVVFCDLRVRASPSRPSRRRSWTSSRAATTRSGS